MLPRLWNRPEPKADQQPLTLEHLRDMGRGVPTRILSNDAYGAFFVLAASRVRVADAYPRLGGGWTLELHGAYPWQECRFSPDHWQAFYDVHLRERYKAGTLDGAWWLTVTSHLASEYPNGQLASTVDSIVRISLRMRGEVA